jgi:hypothetical protein
VHCLEAVLHARLETAPFRCFRQRDHEPAFWRSLVVGGFVTNMIRLYRKPLQPARSVVDGLRGTSMAAE